MFSGDGNHGYSTSSLRCACVSTVHIAAVEIGVKMHHVHLGLLEH